MTDFVTDEIIEAAMAASGVSPYLRNLSGEEQDLLRADMVKSLEAAAPLIAAAAITFVVEWEEYYAWKKSAEHPDGADPLTPDHVFGSHVLEMRPRDDLLPRSRAHMDQRINAIISSFLSRAAINATKEIHSVESRLAALEKWAHEPFDFDHLVKRLEAVESAMIEASEKDRKP